MPIGVDEINFDGILTFFQILFLDWNSVCFGVFGVVQSRDLFAIYYHVFDFLAQKVDEKIGFITGFREVLYGEIDFDVAKIGLTFG